MPRPPDPRLSAGRVALVVGRFQPPHRGHLPLLWATTTACDLVVVRIGSAERHGTWEDPLTFEERAACLRAVLGDRMRPVALNDIGSTPATADWADCVLGRVAAMGLPAPTDVFAPRRAEAKWYAPRFAPLDGPGVLEGDLRRFERAGRATHVLEARADAAASASEIWTLAMQGDPEWEALVPSRMRGVVAAGFDRLRRWRRLPRPFRGKGTFVPWAHGSLVLLSSKRRWTCPTQSILPCCAVGTGPPGSFLEPRRSSASGLARDPRLQGKHSIMIKTLLLAGAAVVGLSVGASAQGFVLGTGNAGTQSQSGTANVLQGGTGLNSAASVLGLTAGGVSTSASASGNGATSGAAGFTSPLAAFSNATNSQSNSFLSSTNGFTAGLGFGTTTVQGGSGGVTEGLSQSQAGAAFNVLGGFFFGP